MDTPNRAATHKESEMDSFDTDTARRARKNHTVLTARNRRSQMKNKKRRRSGGESSVVGMSHRRNRRWSW